MLLGETLGVDSGVYRMDSCELRASNSQQTPWDTPYMPSKTCVDWTWGAELWSTKRSAQKIVFLGWRHQAHVQDCIEWTLCVIEESNLQKTSPGGPLTCHSSFLEVDL